MVLPNFSGNKYSIRTYSEFYLFILGLSGLSGYAKVTGFGIQSDDKGKVYEE